MDDAGVDLAIALEEAENGRFTHSTTPARAFAPAAEVRLVALDLAAERAVQFSLSGQAAADDLIDALGAMTVNVHDVGGAARGHFQGEVLDQLIELAIRQLTVFN